MRHELTFAAVAEARPGPKWRARWERSWPDYEAWFLARGGDAGPDRAACDAALAAHMPELVPVHARLTALAGGGDRAARFLSAWCPPPYLGGCSLSAVSDASGTRLVRNYDLAPDLNEGLLLRSEWTGQPVMGMVEFLWGLSDGINARGLSVALAFGGRSETAQGFGICLILRYVLETCGTVAEALAVLERVPSHMAYNLVLADRRGATASVEMLPGGGLRRMRRAIATNHQHGEEAAERADFTRTLERRAHLEAILARGIRPGDLARRFLEAPLYRTDWDRGFGTLFTAEYDPEAAAMTLHWADGTLRQTLEAFVETERQVGYGEAVEDAADWFDTLRPWLGSAETGLDAWIAGAKAGRPDWTAFGALFAGGSVVAGSARGDEVIGHQHHGQQDHRDEVRGRHAVAQDRDIAAEDHEGDQGEKAVHDRVLS